jgi:transketolase
MTTSKTTAVQSATDIDTLARQLRVDSIRMSTSAGSGHPTSSLSAADLMAVLLARYLRIDWTDASNRGNDHLIFSKGHASPLLYAMHKAAGVASDEELMSCYRRVGSRWLGHPTPALPFVDVATGSLGQGLPVGVGIALAGKFLETDDYHVWVLCGDSEMAEGSMWEALDKAGHFGLDNLTVVVDVNELGMRGPTALGWDLEQYANRVSAFGCVPVAIDGHDYEAIDEALDGARNNPRPTVVLARTIKGRGVPELEDRNGWHGRPLPPDMADRAVAELGGVGDLRIRPLEPGSASSPPAANAGFTLPQYDVGTPVATRTAYGETLAALGADQRVVVVDAEVGNSTHADRFQRDHADRYFDVFTAEQQMIAAAVGLSVRGYVPFAATFAAFLTRAHDFIRMAAISQANIRLAGSHAGVEVGPDGSSQMALEDLAMMRSVLDSIVLYPSDATSTARLTAAMRKLPGISYLRTTRGAYPVLYPPTESFPIPGSKVLLSHPHDRVTLIGAGVTVHTSLAAAAALAEHGIRARVLDVYTIKPLDALGIVSAAHATGGKVVVAEDHHAEGGLGEAVLAVLADAGGQVQVEHLAVRPCRAPVQARSSCAKPVSRRTTSRLRPSAWWAGRSEGAHDDRNDPRVAPCHHVRVPLGPVWADPPFHSEQRRVATAALPRDDSANPLRVPNRRRLGRTERHREGSPRLGARC